MARIFGFGTVKGSLAVNGTDGAGIHIVELRFGVPARIRQIFASIQPFVPAGWFAFNVASVWVIEGKVQGSDQVNLFPNPYTKDEWFPFPGPSLANPIFEHRWAGTATGNKSKTFDFGPVGIPLEANTTYSVLLPLPGSQDANPISFEQALGVLSVQGEQIKGKDPFGELR